MSELQEAAKVKPLPREREGCPVCSHEERTHLYRDPRYDETQNRDIVQCDNCGMAYVSPLVMQVYQDIEIGFYEKDIWEGSGDYIQNLYVHWLLLEGGIKDLCPAILELPEGNRNLLEIGCGLGYMMDVARARGWNSIGLEICRAAADWGKRYLGLDIRTESLEQSGLPENSFHTVAMVEVLEHLQDPLATVRKAWELLCPGGIIFITVPNFATLYRVKVGWKWDAIDPYGHIMYFTMNSLHRLVKMAGFKRITLRANGGETYDDTILLWAIKE